MREKTVSILNSLSWSIQPKMGLVKGAYYREDGWFTPHPGDSRDFYGVLEVVSEGGKLQMVEFNEFNNWDDFLIISRDIKENDALMIVMSRRNYPSYLKNMTMIPTYLNKYFCKNSCILVYPMQIGIGEQELGALKSIPHADSHDSLDDLADVLRGLFKRNK